MKYNSIKTLSNIREEIFSIQKKIEKEKGKGNPVGEIHKSLGMLSNQIMRYMHNDLKNSDSQDELLFKLETLTKESQDSLPYFIDLKNNIEAIIYNRTIIQEYTDYNNKIQETAQKLIQKVTQK
jgi:hypothetical protein